VTSDLAVEYKNGIPVIIANLLGEELRGNGQVHSRTRELLHRLTAAGVLHTGKERGRSYN